MRALIACGWFGIQTWIGGLAIHEIISIVWPAWRQLGGDAAFMGYGLPQFISFFIFWLMNMVFVWAGTESIKWMETLAAPFLLAMGILLLVWASSKVGGIGTILQKSDALIQSQSDLPFSKFLPLLFIPWLTAMVGYWATLSLNIPDFTRYAKSQKDQVIGQGIGLLTTMPLFAFIGIAVTSATLILYGEAIWNPVTLLARLTAEYDNPMLGLLAMLVLVVATLSTNIAANVVSPANSFSNLLPQKINFRLGGLIAGVIGIFIFPWLLLDRYQTWLISYSGLLGAAVGVMVCDYVVIRKGILNVRDLYSDVGQYTYVNGFNWKALFALSMGILVALLGKVSSSLQFLFNGAWFSAAIVSFVVYYVSMRNTKR